MNPSTGHLVELRYADVIPEGYVPLPDHLAPVARKALNGRSETVISLTSGGKLSKWAAGKRKERRRMARESRKANRR